MPGEEKDNNILVMLLSQVNQSNASISNNMEGVKNSIIRLADITDKQNVLLAEIKQGQKQYQMQAMKNMRYVIIILILIIGGLLMSLNVKGGETIVDIVSKVFGK